MSASRATRLAKVKDSLFMVDDAATGLAFLVSAVRYMGREDSVSPPMAAGMSYLGTLAVEDLEHQLRVIHEEVDAMRAEKQGKPALKLADPGTP